MLGEAARADVDHRGAPRSMSYKCANLYRGRVRQRPPAEFVAICKSLASPRDLPRDRVRSRRDRKRLIESPAERIQNPAPSGGKCSRVRSSRGPTGCEVDIVGTALRERGGPTQVFGSKGGAELLRRGVIRQGCPAAALPDRVRGQEWRRGRQLRSTRAACKHEYGTGRE